MAAIATTGLRESVRRWQPASSRTRARSFRWGRTSRDGFRSCSCTAPLRARRAGPRWSTCSTTTHASTGISRHFEPWFFSYNSSSPIAYSSYLLRRSLTDAVNKIDPQATDADLRRMVVIGHSQGGLLTKITAIHSGNAFWNGISRKDFAKVRLDVEDRALLQAVLFVEPLPFVDRVVFICTPHGGSYLAASGWVRSIITRLVSLPATVTKTTVALLTLNPDLASVTTLQTPNVVDNMTPGNRFIKTLHTIPVAPNVPANSIIAVRGDGPFESGDDGVVKYESAHVAGVESEKVVRSSHSTQALPETIGEVRRILLEHAEGAPPPAVHETTIAREPEPAGKKD